MNLREKEALEVAAESIERMCSIPKFLEGKAGIHICIADSGYRAFSCDPVALCEWNAASGEEIGKMRGAKSG